MKLKSDPNSVMNIDVTLKQTKKELLSENRSLRKQIKSLLERKEALQRELMGLEHRIQRKYQFHLDNVITIAHGKTNDRS